jgi:glutamate dehydrogenase
MVTITSAPGPDPLAYTAQKNGLLDHRKPSPQPTHLGVPMTHRSHTVQDNGSGYDAPKFEGKGQQMETVMDQIEQKGFIPSDLVEAETRWFYDDLGIDDMYFSTETVEAVVSHIHSLYAAKIAAYARDDHKVEIRLDKEAADHAVYIDTSIPGVSAQDGSQFEKRLEKKYLDASSGAQSFRMESFRSPSKLPNTDQSLRCYFIYQSSFKNPKPSPEETSVEVLGDERFLSKATANTKAIYQSVLDDILMRAGPVIDMYDVEGTREKRLVVGFKHGSAIGLFAALSDLYHYYGLTSSRKYIEQFSNGITILSIYLRPAENIKTNHPPIEASIHQVMKEVSLLYCIPQSRFQLQFSSGQLSLQEATYAHCVWVFTHHFLNRLGNEYNTLTTLLDPNNSVHAELLSRLKKRLRSETFTAEYVLDIISSYPELVRSLYLAFANKHYVHTRGDKDDFLPTLSYLRMKVVPVLSDDALQSLITRTAVNEHHQMVMSAFCIFNQAVLKTNFYTPTKVALSFRLNPSFLPTQEYPQPLYGMFLVIASEFRGFHLRFRDVARGGIRIVKSRSTEAYAINARSLFDENYNLANTQQRKNKDIPEGGSKGVILLDPQHQDKATGAFEKYIDSILDLLLPATSPGIKDPIVDLHGKQEILFMGPDENTADLVDWATEHARLRGAPWWKSFFTGKSPRLGGIPHDVYGMTTLSVREYVQGIYREKGMDETQVRKLQTGGPDGDLGSNEILLGREKYVAVVDGSGVLVDPQGIDREELLRLAKSRKMIVNFDTSRLSTTGYRVLVEDTNTTLPSGEVVLNGTSFRNTFHLRPGEADNQTDAATNGDTPASSIPPITLFVPCGGRPESIDSTTVTQLIDPKTNKSLIPYIVEGANLFLTQDAKLRLEKAGCVIFKDASANKGGVTSSSLEVLAALAFDDDGFRRHMCCDVLPTPTDANGLPTSTKENLAPPPAFYKSYVAQVQSIIRQNARLEFSALWRAHESTGTPFSILSDRLSAAIIAMDEELQARTELWEDTALRTSVLSDALPAVLVEAVGGLEKVLARVPQNYLRAIFGSYLASRFVYSMGIDASPVSFWAFMRDRVVKAAADAAAGAASAPAAVTNGHQV